MGRIVANVRIGSLLDPGKTLECDALVDTGSAYMVLPKAWQGRLGKLNVIREIDCEAATQALVRGRSAGRSKSASKDSRRFTAKSCFSTCSRPTASTSRSWATSFWSSARQRWTCWGCAWCISKKTDLKSGRANR